MRQTRQLVYPLWLRLLSAVLIVMPVGAAIVVWGEGEPQQAWHELVPWAILSAWLFLTYQVFLVELWYDDRHVIYLSPLAGEVRLSWGEISGLFYVRELDGYFLEAQDGRRIWFNDWRLGIDDFAETINTKLALKPNALT